MSGIENMKYAKTQLLNCVLTQLEDIPKANTRELGEVIDMIKDLSEAVYYCTITDSMEHSSKDEYNKDSRLYYTSPYYNMPMYGDAAAARTQDGSYTVNRMTTGMYDTQRDPREGRSPMRRRMYMQGKETHNDPKTQLMELEAYLQELSSDITEMTKNASTEEKSTLRRKMTSLADKII